MIFRDEMIMDTIVNKPWHTANFCNIAGALRWQAERQPGTTAIHFADSGLLGQKRFSSYNYLQFNELTDAYARSLKATGLQTGDRVVLMLEPGFTTIAMFYALLKLGAVPVLIDPGMDAAATGRCIDETEPVGLDEGLRPRCRDPPSHTVSHFPDPSVPGDRSSGRVRATPTPASASPAAGTRRGRRPGSAPRPSRRARRPGGRRPATRCR